MSLCAICKKSYSEKVLNDIYTKEIGDPPILIKQLLLRITLGIENEYASSNVCRKCTQKCSQYYNASLVIDNIGKYILNAIQGEESDEIPESKLKVELESNSNDNSNTFFFRETLEVKEEEEEEEFIETIKDEDCSLETNPLEENNELKTIEDEDVQLRPSPSAKNEQENKRGKRVKKNTPKVAARKLKAIKKEENLNEEKKTSIDCSQSVGILIYHSSGIGQPIGVHCKLCDRTFEHPKTFKAHKKYIGFAGYVCDSCGITCFSQSGFVAHVKRHTSPKEFQCTQCDAAFYRKAGLTQHIARHKGETPFQCEVCAKCFVHRAALGKHKTIHDETTRRIDCKVCEKKFRTVSHLRRHMAIHTGAKPFSCPVCGNRFSQAYNMKAHMKLHDESQLNKDIQTRSVCCQKCNKDFTNLLEYQEHINSCL